MSICMTLWSNLRPPSAHRDKIQSGIDAEKRPDKQIQPHRERKREVKEHANGKARGSKSCSAKQRQREQYLEKNDAPSRSHWQVASGCRPS